MDTIKVTVEFATTNEKELDVPIYLLESEDYIGNLSEYLGEEVVNAYWSPFIEE